MPPSLLDIQDQEARLHAEQDGLKWQIGYHPRQAKQIERTYRERLVAVLQARGLDVQVLGANSHGDLVVSGRLVELKVARPRRKRGRTVYWQGLLHAPAHRQSLHGEIVILLCVVTEGQGEEMYPFIIPRLLVGGRRTIEISQHPAVYRGQWASFLEAYNYLQVSP